MGQPIWLQSRRIRKHNDDSNKVPILGVGELRMGAVSYQLVFSHPTEVDLANTRYEEALLRHGNADLMILILTLSTMN